MDGAPPGERLADTLHQEKVAGTCKDEKSVLLFVINNPLNLGKQLGNKFMQYGKSTSRIALKRRGRFGAELGQHRWRGLDRPRHLSI